MTLRIESCSSTGAKSDLKNPLFVLALLNLKRNIIILLSLDPLLRRPCPPTFSARNLKPDRELHPPVLSPHMALCVFIPSRHRPPSHYDSHILHSTFISVKTGTTGTDHSTSSTESRWTHSSRAESKLSGFTGRMTTVICLTLSLVRVKLAIRPLLSILS